MVAITSAYSSTSYVNLANTLAASTAKPSAATTTESTPTATDTVTLSSAAMAALATKSFTTVIADARAKLDAMLTGSDRKSPLHSGKLAIDLASLDPRELYAMANDASFTADEKTAAGLEMQRRLEAALVGPAAITDVTGNYTGLYKAAATYLDSLGAEEKAEPDWIAARAAITEGLKQLQADPKTLPDAGDSDPVAIYLALAANGGTGTPRPIADVATTARGTIDALYAEALAGGKAPTFNKDTTTGTYIDLSKLDSRTLSSMVLDTTGKFTTTEVSAAKSTLHAKSGAALLAGFQSAAKSSDPTAFSQNIISLYSAMSSEERQAVGWSADFYQAALGSYQSTSKLLDMFSQAGGTQNGFLSWMGK